MRISTFAFAAVILASQPAVAELIILEQVGPIEIETFECHEQAQPHFIKRYCYDGVSKTMLFALNEPPRWYRYCDVEPKIFSGFEAAPSRGRFFNYEIKEWAQRGNHLCYVPPRPGEFDPLCEAKMQQGEESGR